MAVVATGCGGGTEARAIIASAPGSVGVGEQRVLVAVTDPSTDESVASQEVIPVATLRDRIGSPLGVYEGEFVWIVPNIRGMYAFQMDLPGAGTFQMTLDGGEWTAGPVGFIVVEDPHMVVVGDRAPASETRTLGDTPLDELTSDDEPDPAFYEMSVAEAVEAGPSVIIFATPAWCASQSCGPMLDQVKVLSAVHTGLNYVHVEVYENIRASSFDDLVLVPAVEEWSLPTEPWVFVTDSSGVVTSRFEGAVSDRELEEAIRGVSP